MEHYSKSRSILSQSSFFIEIIQLSVRDATTQTTFPLSSIPPPKLPRKRPRSTTPSKLPTSRSFAPKISRNSHRRK